MNKVEHNKSELELINNGESLPSEPDQQSM